MDVSLTSFIDFVSTTGKSKISKVADIKNGNWSVMMDFYKPLREGMVVLHRANCANPASLDAVVAKQTDAKKKRRYPPCVKGHKKFIRANAPISWFSPPKDVWSSGSLDVRINPELGIEFNGTRHVTKLYFKDKRITAGQADLILGMMEMTLRPKMKAGSVVALLDVERGKLHVPKAVPTGIGPLLVGEAATFVGIWNSLP